ncbi:MAG: hypothetical protein RI894_1428 [Bacteroidota bacterium]|jgi:hypothetical protein
MAKIIKFSLEVSDMEHEALTLMLKKANLTTDDILGVNLKRWVLGNTDLLNDKEKERFAPILTLKNVRPTKNAAKQK